MASSELEVSNPGPGNEHAYHDRQQSERNKGCISQVDCDDEICKPQVNQTPAPIKNRLPSSNEEGKLGRWPSGGGWGLSTKAAVRGHQRLRTTPTAAAGCCLPLLVQGGERRHYRRTLRPNHHLHAL